MTCLRTIAVCFSVLAFGANATAGIRPSFGEIGCAWNATHIVVVTKLEKIDGNFEVLESWKGDLKKGDHISVRQLADFASDDSRRVSKGMFRKDATDLPTHVTCSRMVLFLIKSKPDTTKGVASDWTWASADPIYKDNMKVSVAWVEAGKVYAFEQEHNPGESLLLSLGITEREMRDSVEETVRAHERLSKSLAEDDAAKLRDMAVALAKPEHLYVARQVITALGGAGKKALPALGKLLADDRLGSEHDDILRELGRAGGAEAGPDLVAVLKQELEYWKAKGPGLTIGWWNSNGTPWEEVERARRKWMVCLAAIETTGKLHYKDGREAIVAYRALWKSLPQLGDDDISKACDEALSKLQ